MTAHLESALVANLQTAAQQAGLVVLSTDTGSDFNGHPTTRFRLATTAAAPAERTLLLELSEAFDFHKPELLPEMTTHLREAANRLRNPRPDAYVTLAGLPVSFSDFAWPFHRSTSGADTYIVHGTLHLEDGAQSPLHALVSASMTVTFAEIVPRPSSRTPRPSSTMPSARLSTAANSSSSRAAIASPSPLPPATTAVGRRNSSSLTRTTRAAWISSRSRFTGSPAFSAANQPVWIADPRDAQYLNTTASELSRMAADLARQGLLALDGEYASATPSLLDRAEEYHAKLAAALAVTRPTFNEEMRAGHTNM